MSQTKKRRRRHGREHWRKVVARQEDSGQPVNEFCRINDIGEKSFYAWRRRLRSVVSGSISTTPKGFIELRCKSSTALDSAIRVRHGEFAIEVNAGFDDGALRRVLHCLVEVTSKTAGVRGR